MPKLDIIKKNGVGQITLNLIEDISVLFSLNEVTSKNIIGNWVGNTLQMEVSYAQWVVFKQVRSFEGSL